VCQLKLILQWAEEACSVSPYSQKSALTKTTKVLLTRKVLRQREETMELPLFTSAHFQTFFWVLLRVSVITFMLPFFGARGLPSLWKIGFAMVLTIVMLPTVPQPVVFPHSTIGFVVVVVSEVLTGFALALGVKFLLSSVQLAGKFMGFQMGFNMASVMDPQTGGQSSVMSQFLYLVTVLIFFSINGHHAFIRALAYSFQAIPPNGFTLSGPIVMTLVKVSAEMFVIALKLSAPILIALFLSNLGLGIVARTVPQVNILMVGFPVNIGLGLILLGITMNSLSPFLVGLVRRMAEILMRMIQMV